MVTIFPVQCCYSIIDYIACIFWARLLSEGACSVLGVHAFLSLPCVVPDSLGWGGAVVPLYQLKPVQLRACQGLSWDGPGTPATQICLTSNSCARAILRVLCGRSGYWERSGLPTGQPEECSHPDTDLPTNAGTDPRVAVRRGPWPANLCGFCAGTFPLIARRVFFWFCLSQADFRSWDVSGSSYIV